MPDRRPVMRRAVPGGVFNSRSTGPVNVTVTPSRSLPELSETNNVRERLDAAAAGRGRGACVVVVGAGLAGAGGGACNNVSSSIATMP